VNPRFRALAVNILGPRKGYPTDLTDKRELESLLQKLAPLSTAKELIRLGPKGDGGYLAPNDLEGIEACFSPGVSSISGFEKDCAERGMEVFLADKSVERPAESHERFHFTRKFVGVATSDHFMTLDDWVAMSLPGSLADLLLQMDIEGYEYETFLGASDGLMRRFRIIIAEFHSMDQFWNRPFFQLASRAFEKILQTHSCVHIHPNNCRGSLKKWGLEIPQMAEFTFLRNDRIVNPTPAAVFPNPLDGDNTDDPPLPLPACWYGKR
jgi:hypothetical protein